MAKSGILARQPVPHCASLHSPRRRAESPLSGLQHDPMSTTLLVVQILNGLQLGILLFLIAAGLTLVFGVMDFINLAHGVQYMLGAYLAVAFYAVTGNFLAALVLALAAALLFGLLLEFVVFRHLSRPVHL